MYNTWNTNHTREEDFSSLFSHMKKKHHHESIIFQQASSFWFVVVVYHTVIRIFIFQSAHIRHEVKLSEDSGFESRAGFSTCAQYDLLAQR